MTKKKLATKRKPGKIAKTRNDESGVHEVPKPEKPRHPFAKEYPFTNTGGVVNEKLTQLQMLRAMFTTDSASADLTDPIRDFLGDVLISIATEVGVLGDALIARGRDYEEERSVASRIRVRALMAVECARRAELAEVVL